MFTIPASEVHLDLMPMREGDDHGADLREYISRGPAQAYILDGKPVGVIGLIHRGHVGCIWALLSNSVRGHGVALTKITKKVLDFWMDSMDIDELQAVVDPVNMEYQRWARLVGFQFYDVIDVNSPKGTVPMFLYVKGGPERWQH